MVKNHGDFDRLWYMTQTLVYFCGKNGELMPTEEPFFLTEFVCALNELLTGEEEFHSCGDYDHSDWGRFLNNKLSLMFSNLKTKKIFSEQLTDDLERMTKLTWNSDEWGDGEYMCVFLTAYKASRDNSGYCDSTFKLRSKGIERLEKVIPTISSEFLGLCQKITPIVRKYVDNDIDPKTNRLKEYYW